MKVLVACEFSGAVRDAFAATGHDAWRCDILPTESLGNHYQCDVREVLAGRRFTANGECYPHSWLEPWDLMVAHPPCTHLAVSGARWFKGKEREQAESLDFVRELMNAPIQKIALENPVSVISSKIRKPDQIVQPWWFGHGETKATCLWLKNLLPLAPTDIVAGRDNRIHFASPGPDRWKERSRTLPGIAAAMAKQWGHQA